MRKTSMLLSAVILLFLLTDIPVSHAQNDDLQRAKLLNQKVVQLHGQGKYAEAAPIANEALAIREKTLGLDHPDVAASLNNLAELYRLLGDYARAEPLYKRSLAIREKALGPNHPYVAESLNNQALLYNFLGDHAKAELLFKHALVILEKALGTDHPYVATILNNLADLYRASGDYAKAESFSQRALAIREKALGPDHPNVALSLNNLAALYYCLGDYAKAGFLYKRALAIREKALGPNHPDVAEVLNNLALLYQSLGDYAKAEPLYKRVLAILEKALGPDHPHVATSLNNLAELYRVSSDYAKAEPLYQRSLAIREKALGPDHPYVAQSRNNLALLYQSLGDYVKAEPLFQRARTIREKALGPDHPDVAQSINNLAVLLAAEGKLKIAHSLFVRAQGIDAKIIDQILGFASEDRQARFLATKQGNLEGSLSLVAIHLREDPSARKDALDIWLRRKGVVLESQRRFQEALTYSDDPKAVTTFQELARVRSQLSQLTFAGPGKEGPEVYRQKISELETTKNDLEATLSILSRAYALKKKIERADSSRVAQALPVKTALLEFVRINTFNFKAKGKEKKWLPPRYLVFVLHAGGGDRVEMVDLGDAEEIDRNITLLRTELNAPEAGLTSKALETSRKLHDLVFKPLTTALGDVKEIFISPDGNLNLIPFEVLQGPGGKYLIEDYTFNYLAAGRDVVGFGEIKEKGGKALLMGDPDFDMGMEEKGSTLRKLGLREVRDEAHVRRSTEMRGLRFSRLPRTGMEVESIRGMMDSAGVESFTGKQALEEVLRQKNTPRVLHLATHGFFLSDQDLSALREEGMARGIEGPRAQGPAIRGVKIENPLLRSGIALAGANSALKSGELDKSDGLVTAEKILGLRLRGTDLVVLSACETGLGEVKSGEGVYGLRRAFIQAGTRGLVMSMWSVPDRETKELMLEFYRNVLQGEMSRSRALRAAALWQMRIVKERYGHANPFYWGAFVFLGEP